MTSSSYVPVSEIIKSTSDPDEPKKKSRDDWRKAKELEEARKAGTAPAAVDEEGKDINPHIPQYISAAPWYYGTRGPTLKHQKIQAESVKQHSGIDEWYKRGVNTASSATKYRKGACENCGAVTHKKKDCLERPRKIGAKFSGAKIAPDEWLQPELSRDYDGKRDRWAGYDPSQHRAVVEHYAKVDAAKRQLRAEKLKSASQGDGQADEEIPDEDLKRDDDLNDEDDDKYVDEVDMPGTKVDSKQRITVRNLRIREDTAKYLRNLDPNSAYYDPKTRSMRDNPYDVRGDAEVDYKGENFVRFTGDTINHAKSQLFAWEAHEKGVEVHPLGEPTRLEILRKQYDEKKEEFKKKGELGILDKYGGAEHLDAPPKELLLAQTEHYAEYTRHGALIKGQEKQIVRSKYEEDVFNNNHTSVWGSYWRSGKWGYRCCHSVVKGSYCTGEKGRLAASSSIPVIEGGPRVEGGSISMFADDGENVSYAQREISIADGDKSSSSSYSSSSSSSSSSDDSSSSDSSSSSDEDAKKPKENKKKKKKKKKKTKAKKAKKPAADRVKKAKNSPTEEEQLKEALRKEEEAQREGDRLAKLDDRKRSYNSMVEVTKPTDLEMEAYYMKRKRDDDPMAQFM